MARLSTLAVLGGGIFVCILGGPSTALAQPKLRAPEPGSFIIISGTGG